jgi:O-antigen/teichoic acid export membrane protein
MKAFPRHLFRNILHLGVGEAVARLCGIATFVFLAHAYGVILVGVYALSQSIAQYSQLLIDFGLRHIGARLIARNPLSAHEIVRRVQRRRLLMAGLVLPLILGYAALARLPLDMKVVLFVFAVTCALYALSLDWAAWGKAQLRFVGLAKAVVPATILVFLTLGRGSAQRALWWIVAGNALGFVQQAIICWAWWRRHRPTENVGDLDVISDSLKWRRTSVMGVAWLGNLAFSSIDMLMLGVMSDPEQVGLYSAAYRVLNQVLLVYYLVTQSLYPHFAQQTGAERTRMLRPRILLSLLAAGVVIAALIAVSRRPVLEVLFGRQFLLAGPLLLLLAWAIPLDFLTSYLSNAYIAWGMEKKILFCTIVAAGSNVVLNLFWIPMYGAKAAAVNTVISYAIFLTSLALAGWSAKELDVQAQPGTVAQGESNVICEPLH